MNTLDRISADVFSLSEKLQYGANPADCAEGLQDAARKLDSTSDEIIAAADGITAAAQNIGNLAALAFGLRDDDYSQDIYRRITEQLSQLRNLALAIRRGMPKNTGNSNS